MSKSLRESGRVKEQLQAKVLDSFARQKIQRKRLNDLESDNFQEDPKNKLDDLPPPVPAALTDDGTGKKPKKKKPLSASARLRKERLRMTFAQLIDEAKLGQLPKDIPTYTSVEAPPSKFPQRHYCAVCGFTSNYTCVTCGTRFCSTRCLTTHKETRCLKWTS